MTRVDVQLTLRRTGGLAGIELVAQLDTRELGADEAAACIAAVEPRVLAGLAAAPGDVAAAHPGAADGLQYELAVRAPGREQTVHFGERQAPSALQPLVRDLMARAAPAPRA